MLLLVSSRMPPTRPEDVHRTNSSRQSDGKGETGRHGSMGGSRRNVKLDVKFLLNPPQSGASASPNSDNHFGRPSGQGGSASRPRPERRTPPSGGSGQRRFRCESCSATFAQSHDALKHKRFVENTQQSSQLHAAYHSLRNLTDEELNSLYPV